MLSNFRSTPKYMNNCKLERMRKIDSDIHKLKQLMSKFVHANIVTMLAMDDRKFAAEYACFFTSRSNPKEKTIDPELLKEAETLSQSLSVNELRKLLEQVCLRYRMRYETGVKNQKLGRVQKSFSVSHYKRSTKRKKAGDVKDRKLKMKNSPFAPLLKYLMKVVSTDPTFKSITNKAILEKLESYSDETRERIFTYINNKYKDVVASILVIEFKTGTHVKDPQSSYFIYDGTNEKFKVWYRYHISRGNDIYLPVQVNLSYHDIKDFTEKSKMRWHTVKLDCNGKKITVGMLRDRPDTTFPAIDEDKRKVSGIDVNVVGHLIACSDPDMMYDVDKRFLEDAVVLMKKIDAIGDNNLKPKDMKKIGKLVRRSEGVVREVIAHYLKDCVKKGVTDIVAEDLLLDGKCWNQTKDGMKLSRIIRWLHLSGIKHWLFEQAEKKGIRVHITPSQYTSQMCPECGHIDRANRRTQENFICVHCGHEDNADHNAAVNIRNRYTEDVLRDSDLHTKDRHGRLQPNKYVKDNKATVKKILLEKYIPSTSIGKYLPVISPEFVWECSPGGLQQPAVRVTQNQLALP